MWDYIEEKDVILKRIMLELWNYIDEKMNMLSFTLDLCLKQVYIVLVAIDKIIPGDLVESDMSSVQFSSVAQL